MTDTVQPVDYGRFLAMADRILTRWGQVGRLKENTFTGPAHNPVRGVPRSTPARFAETDYRADQIDGTRIKASDKEVYLTPSLLTFPPVAGQEVIDAAGVRVGDIIKVQTIKPALTIVLYVLQVRA